MDDDSSSRPRWSTLVADIEKLLTDGLESVPQETLDNFIKASSSKMSSNLTEKRRDFTLRLSNIGSPCVRKLWLEKNFPEMKIPFPPATKMKFSFGDLTEEYVLFLAELAGHKVELRQQKITIAGIDGHWDVVIDGLLTDCKSASTFSFKKFKEGLKPEDDAFGYLTQLGGYHSEAKKLPEVTEKTKAAFLVFDKQHGHLCLDVHEFEDKDYEEQFKNTIKIMDSDVLPDRAFPTKPDGYTNYKVKPKKFMPNGNELLGTNCSYCDMKFACYDNIRTFLSSTGPKYFTRVVKEPKMMEISNKEVIESGGIEGPIEGVEEAD